MNSDVARGETNDARDAANTFPSDERPNGARRNLTPTRSRIDLARARASSSVASRRDKRERRRRSLPLRNGGGGVRDGLDGVVRRGAVVVGGRRGAGFGRRTLFREKGVRGHRRRRRRARRAGRRARPAHLGLQARLRVHDVLQSVPQRAARRRLRRKPRRLETPGFVCLVSRCRRRRLAGGETAEVHARLPRRRRRHRPRYRVFALRDGKTRATERVRDAGDRERRREGRRRRFGVFFPGLLLRLAPSGRPGGRRRRVSARRLCRGGRVERALEPQQTGLRVHLDLELADLLARLAQAGLEAQEKPVEEMTSQTKGKPESALRDSFRARNAKPGAGLSRTRSSRRSRAASVCLSRCNATTMPACASAFAVTAARRRASARSCRSCVRGAVAVSWRQLCGPRLRASGENETGRTFALCWASSWFTITRRLNVFCCGVGVVSKEGSGARGRACHGVSRMERVLRSGETRAAGLARAGRPRSAQRNELRTM